MADVTELLARQYTRDKDGKFSTTAGGPGTGRDLIATPEQAEALAQRVWDAADQTQFGPHGDEVLYNIVKEQGFDAPVEVVPKGQMEAVQAEHKGLFRGVAESRTGQSPEEIYASMATGEAYQGRGVAGNGMYLTTRASEAGEYGTVRAFALHRDAKSVDHDTMHAEQKAFLSQLDRGSLAYAVFSDRGRFAAAKGYDAYEWEFGELDGSTTGRAVVLNRGALLMEEG